MRKFITCGLVAVAAAAGATETTPEAAAFFEDGVAQTNAGKYEEAIAAFEKSLAADPNLVEAHEWIAHILILGGDFEGAIERYQKIVARRPSTESKVSLGLAYLRVGDVDMAVKTLSSAVAADPGNCKGWNNLSLAYLGQGEVVRAREAAEKAIALDAGYGPAYVNLGNVHLRQGEAEAAIASFRKALTLEAGLADAYFGLGEAYSFLNDEQAAGDNYIKYLRHGNADPTRRSTAVKWLWDHGRGAEVPK
jgi:Tfp pilus assembly protein PilF